MNSGSSTERQFTDAERNPLIEWRPLPICRSALDFSAQVDNPTAPRVPADGDRSEKPALQVQD